MKIITVAILIIMLITISMGTVMSLGLTNDHNNGLVIITTFPWLYEDLLYILCENDSIIYLLRPGIDPHEYMLTPSDVENLKKADIIISTAHTPFELKIKELIDKKELRAKLIEIPSTPNIIILNNSTTGQPNYHALLFYPENYIAFLKYLENILSSTRPECREVYNLKISSLINNIENISVNTPKLSTYIALLDTPVLQYISYWLGIRKVFIVQKEHDAPITPSDITMAEDILRNNINVIIFTTNSSNAYNLLIEMSRKYGKPILILQNVVATNSIIDVLRYVSTNMKLLIQNTTTTSPMAPSIQLYSINIRTLLYVAIVITVLMIIVLLYRRKLVRP